MSTKNSRKSLVFSFNFVLICNNLKTSSEDLPAYLEKWNLGDAGFKYNVVAVFGSQSTGKSESSFLYT
jgi:hypothetical protein